MLFNDSVLMRFSLRVFICLLLGTPAVAQDELPSLEELREIGRSRSHILNHPGAIKPSGEAPKADITGFRKDVLPIFQKSCVACHGPDKVKGKFRIDQLNPDLLSGPHINEWLEVYEVVSNSEMPPDDEDDYHLVDAERTAIVDWLGAELTKASQVKRNSGNHTSFRRMTRYEYNYALQDLLGLPYDFVSSLPPESISEDGFKNSSELLQMSSMQFEYYREIGLSALRKATVRGEQPEAKALQFSMQPIMEKMLGDKKLDSFDSKTQRQMHFFDTRARKGTVMKQMPRQEACQGIPS